MAIGNEDAFGNPNVRTPRNLADLAGHYRYSPERYRFYRNGSRELLLYEIAQNGDLDSYPYLSDARPDEEDVFVLQPDAGDTLTFKTAEQFRYRVGYVHELSASFALSRALQNQDDRITFGLLTDTATQELTDGYFIEQTGNHRPEQCDVFERRNGNTVGERKTVTLKAATTVFSRIVLRYNWYNVGEENWAETYTTEKDGQTNRFLTQTTTEPDDSNAGPAGRGPVSGNGQIVCQLEADTNTTDLEAYVGSYAMLALGDVPTISRGPGMEIGDYTPTQTGSWEAVCGFRVDPSTPNVSVQIRRLITTSGSGKTLVVAVDPSNVLKADGTELGDTDFYTPEEHSPANSSLERTDLGVIEEWPDGQGNLGTVHTTPGGYQLTFSTTRAVQRDLSEGKTNASLTKQKHGIRDGDIALLVTKPYTTDALAWSPLTEQDW
jgi:hypothetical protein